MSDLCRRAFDRVEAQWLKSAPQSFALAEGPAMELVFLREVLRIGADEGCPEEELIALLSLAGLPGAVRMAAPHRREIPPWPDLSWVHRGRRGKDSKARRIVELALEHEDAFWFERAAWTDGPLPEYPFTWDQRGSPTWLVDEEDARRVYKVRLGIGGLLPPPRRPRRSGARKAAKQAIRRATGLVGVWTAEIGFGEAASLQGDVSAFSAGKSPLPNGDSRIFRLRCHFLRAGRAEHGALTPPSPVETAEALFARTGILALTEPPEYTLHPVYVVRPGGGSVPKARVGTGIVRAALEQLPIDADLADLEVMIGISWLRSATSMLHPTPVPGDGSWRRKVAGRLTDAEARALARKVEVALFISDEQGRDVIVQRRLGPILDCLVAHRDDGSLAVPWNHKDSLREFIRHAAGALDPAPKEKPVPRLSPDDPILEGESRAGRQARVRQGSD